MQMRQPMYSAENTVKPGMKRVIAVTSGKGGVGKTNVSINLALGLAGIGRRVMVLDADLGMANVDVMLGLRPERTLADVMDGSCNLQDIIIEGPQGIKIIPASSGIKRMADLSQSEHAGMIYAFSALSDMTDVLIVDTAAGISDSVVNFCMAAQEVMIVVCNEPASITDAYAMIKVLNTQYKQDHFRVLVNMAHSPNEGIKLFDKLVEVTGRFLDVSLELTGTIPFDPNIRKAVQKQKAVIEYNPESSSSLAFKKLANQADNWPVPAHASGNLEFFVEQMFRPVSPTRWAQA